MMLKGTVAALLAASSAVAQQILLTDLSFGHQGRLVNPLRLTRRDYTDNCNSISPPEDRGKIPGFSTSGLKTQPQILSNKVILTPVSPGNQRGAIWAEKTLEETEWVADVDLRANGPERGGGNLNIWLTKDGENQVGSSSIYTVGKFEGLALVVDAHGGSGGMLRAFLNDGSVDYASRTSVDELAFGHCLYSYRNLGRPSQVKLRQSRNIFKVEIDGRLCFESDKVSLPTGYKFGVTAATPDNPDSFEIFKLVVMSDRQTGQGQQYEYKSRQNQPKREINNNNIGTQPIGSEDFDEGLPDENADIFQTSREQFQDLHNRLQSTNHQLSSVYRSVSRHHQLDETRHNEVKQLLSDLKADLSKLDQVDQLVSRISALEKEVRGVRNDLGKKMRDNERNFKAYLGDHHATLSQTVLDSMPSHKKLIAVVIGVQVALVAAYVVYKKRKANSPKKYL